MSLKPIEKLGIEIIEKRKDGEIYSIEHFPPNPNPIDIALKINELIEVVNDQSEKIELLCKFIDPITESIKNAGYNFELIRKALSE